MRNEISLFAYQPLISLLVPVYNVEPKWLEKCVDSVRNQSYPNWELCLADDHSSEPHVRPLLERYAQQDSRIKVVFRPENGHISRATNSVWKRPQESSSVCLTMTMNWLPRHCLR